MPTLDKRRLGSTKVEITRLGLGTVPISGFGEPANYAKFESVILSAFERGVRYFDCAPMYGLGLSEHFLGHALRTNEIRDQVVVSTKAGRVLKPASRAKKIESVYGIEWRNGLPFLDDYDYTYDGIMRSFEDSQQRLGLDHIEILYVHDVGTAWHGEKSEYYWDQLRASGYRALDGLRSSGAVGAIGLGVNETESVLGVAKEFQLDCSMIAGRYTLLNHGPLASDFPELQRRNISVVAAGVFNSGVLAGGGRTYDYQSAPASVIERVQALDRTCQQFGVSLATAALRFVYEHPAVACVVQGARNDAEVAQNVDSTTAGVPAALWAELKRLELIPANAPVSALAG
ncbi:aldo/keto reductase [Variovorax ureilyticus]|uniref:Aldo/keto reductase n=1 Tax=Variovorax ureilyticus TaxID=1836198 RepID=A0ABU8VQW9_9BURK